MSKISLKGCTPSPIGATAVFLRGFKETLLKHRSPKTTEAVLLGQLADFLDPRSPAGNGKVPREDLEPTVGSGDTVAGRDGDGTGSEAPLAEAGVNERSYSECDVGLGPSQSNKQRSRKRSSVEHGIDRPQGKSAGLESPSTAAGTADVSPQGKEEVRKKKKAKVEMALTHFVDGV